MKEVLTKDISRIWYEGQYFEKMYKGNKLIWPPDYLRHENINFSFNQVTGEFSIEQDAGFIEYLLDNTVIYLVKSTPDGVVACPLYSEPNYETGGMSYAGDVLGIGAQYQLFYKNGQQKSIYTSQSRIDVMTCVPTIYYSSTEIIENRFDLKFSTYPFDGCHEVFGPDRLIGLYSGSDDNGKWYSNVNVASKHTFTECKELVANKGNGWYGIYSEEVGVLIMLSALKTGINGKFLQVSYAPFGISNPFVNGGGGRNYLSNIDIDPKTNIAHVKHHDGVVEELEVPYIWSASFSELYWDKYLTILPRKKGNGVYNTNNEVWIGNNKGTGIYLSCNENRWSIAADRDDTDVKAMSDNIRIRCCYHGDFTITNDIGYFESLPIL